MDRVSKLCLLLLLTTVVAGMAEKLSGQSQPGTQSVKGPFSLTMSARTPSVKASSVVWVDVRLENTSDHRLAIYKAISEDMDQGGWVYQIDIRDQQGDTPSKTKYAASIVAGGDGGYVPLDPGKTLTHSVNVSKLYDLSRPGKYRIQFRRFDEETKAFVVSNTLTVTVTP